MSDGDLDGIVAACLERMESEGEAAVDDLCRQHPALAEALRRRIGRLREVGLLGACRPSHAADPELAVPERLGEFTLRRLLGGGGMGVVYLAEQEGLGREVALKLVRPEQLYFSGTRERFRREVETISRLQHPGIVPVHTVGEEGGIPYFAMERIRGCTLQEVLRQLARAEPRDLSGRDFAGAVQGGTGDAESHVSPSDSVLGYVFSGTWEEACLRVIQQVAEALEHAHQCGVVHRDIKPSNIMVTPSGRAMLLDFGLASTEGASRLTRTGSQLGSLHYMSPEQCRGDVSAMGPRTDVYALGVTLYELLTLDPAFSGHSAHEVAVCIEEGRPTPVRRLNPAASWEAETVCQRAMELEPARRYARAADLARDLGNVLEKRPIDARRAGVILRAKRWVQRNPAESVSLALGLVLVVGGSTGYALLERDARQRVEEKRLRAEQNFSRATQAVDTMLTRVSDETLRYVPQMEPVRRQLLQDALATYREFIVDSSDDPDVRAETARIHTKVADLHRRLGDHEASVADSREAIALFEKLRREQPGEPRHGRGLAAARQQLAVALAEMGRPAEAETELRLGIGELATLANDRDDARADRVALARLRYELGGILMATDPTVAEREFREYLTIAEQLTQDEPDSTAHLVLAARGYSMLASLLSTAGRWEEVGPLHQRTIEIFERLVLEEPEVREHTRHLADGLYNLSTALFDDLPEEAEAACRRAEEIWEREVSDFPSTPGHRSRLALVRTRIGTLLSYRGEVPAAIDMLSSSADDLRILVRTYPQDVDFRLNLALNLNNLCNRYLSVDRAEDAIAAGEEGIAELEELVRLGPDDAVLRYHLGGVLHTTGRALEATGDSASACAVYERAIEEQRAALELMPEHERAAVYLRNHYWALAEARVRLEQHIEAAEAAEGLIVVFPQSAAEWRRAAGLIARCAWLPALDASLPEDEQASFSEGYDRRAVDLLEGAVEHGYQDADSIRKSPAFARILGWPEVQSLLESLESARER